MRLHTRCLALTATALVAGFALPAHAAATETIACTFSGLAGQFSSPVPAFPSRPDLASFSYRVDFVAWQGDVRGKNGDWRVDGDVLVRPASPDGCLTSGVHAFGLSGDVTLVRF